MQPFSAPKIPSSTPEQIEQRILALQKAKKFSENGLSIHLPYSEYITKSLTEKYQDDAIILKNLKARIEEDSHIRTAEPELFTAMQTEMEFVRQNVDPWFYYARQGNGTGRLLHRNEVREFGNHLYSIVSKAEQLLKKFPNNPYLINLKNYYSFYMGVVVPTAKPDLKLARQDKRSFQAREFELCNQDGSPYYLDGAETLINDDGEDLSDFEEMMRMRKAQKLSATPEFQQEAELLREQMPPHMRIAVINDDPTPFKGWATQNKLAPGTTVTNFKNGHDFIYALKHGQKFDLILNDDEGINSGTKLMLPLRMYAPDTPVFAVTKYEPDTANTPAYFEADMDGYLWYSSTLAESSIGYVEFMRGINNFFRMKKENPSWIRISEK